MRAAYRDYLVMTGLLVLANIFVLFTELTLARLVGGLLLFGVLPGLALTGLAFRVVRRSSLLERILLGIGISYVVSNSVVLGLSAWKGGMHLLSLVVVLDVLSVAALAGSFFMSRGCQEQGGAEEARQTDVWSHVVIILAVVLFFRFAGLGYSQLDGDEVPILSLATRAIDGDHAALLQHNKGVSEVTTALAFVLFSNGSEELPLRSPFALASAASALMLYVLGREVFGKTSGLVAALLFAIEGVFLGFSRLVQYQSLVLFMVISAVYCFWRFSRSREGPERAVFLVMGVAQFAFGFLAHYDGVTALPVLALLYFWGVDRKQWQREVGPLLIGLAVVLVIALPFYLPFFLDPGMRLARAYVADKRLGLGGGPYNRVDLFLFTYWLFYNSTYYVGFMLLTLLSSVWLFVRREWGRLAMAYVAGALFVAGLVCAACFPRLLQAGRANYTFILVLPLCLYVLLARRLRLEARLVWLWFLVALLVYGFAVKLPRLHWYVLMPPWALLSGYAVSRAWEGLQEARAARWARIGAALGAAALFVLFSGYTYLFFIDRAWEYALTFPDHKSVLYWTPQNEAPCQPETLIFGVPRQIGLKTIGYLYRMGVLRGHVRASVDRYLLDWDLGYQRDKDMNARYLLYSYYYKCQSVNDMIQDGYTLEAVKQFYAPVGRVTVNGVPKITIYENKRVAEQTKVVDYANEEYASLYDRLSSLNERLEYRRYGVDSKAFRRPAEMTRVSSGSDDIVIFTDPEQAGPFSYHYEGSLPYRLPAAPLTAEDLDTELKQALGGHEAAYLVMWMPLGSTERGPVDAWLEGQGSRCTRAWYGNTGLARCEAQGPPKLHFLEGVRLGETIDLLSYELDGSALKPGGTVSLTLYWSTSREQPHDYTVFTHLVDGKGQVWGQKDNPPDGGRRPTSGWQEDEVIRDRYEISVPPDAPAGEYQFEIGLYDGTTGARLEAWGQGATPDGRIMLAQKLKVER